MDVTGRARRTSSYSGSNGGACVQVGTPARPWRFAAASTQTAPSWPSPPPAWKTFTAQLKATA